MSGRIRVKKGTPQVPHAVVDGLIDLHAAVDPDTGHFVCHYFAVSLQIVEIDGEDYPGMGIGNHLTVLIGEDPARRVESIGEPIDLGLLASGQVTSVDPGSVSLVFQFYRYQGGRVKAYKLPGGAAAVLVRPEKGDPVTVILWEKKPRRENGAVLTV